MNKVLVSDHSIMISLDKGVKYIRCGFLDYTSTFNFAPKLTLNTFASVNTESWVTNCLCPYFHSGKYSTWCVTRSCFLPFPFSTWSSIFYKEHLLSMRTMYASFFLFGSP